MAEHEVDFLPAFQEAGIVASIEVRDETEATDSLWAPEFFIVGGLGVAGVALIAGCIGVVLERRHRRKANEAPPMSSDDPF